MNGKKLTRREHWIALLKEAVARAYPLNDTMSNLQKIKAVAARPKLLADGINSYLALDALMAGKETPEATTIAEVKAWQAGTSLPKPGQFTALLEQLRAPQPQEEQGQWDADFTQAYKKAVIAAQAEARPSHAMRAPARRVIFSSAVSGGTGGFEARTPPLRHTDGRPAPEHTGHEDYEQLGKARLNEILGATRNATEFLIAYRLFRNQGRAEVGEKLAKSVNFLFKNEIEGGLPEQETVALLQARYFGGDPESGKCYAELVYENRRAIASEALKKGYHHKFGRQLKEASGRLIHQELTAFLQGAPDSLIQARGIYVTFLRRAAGFHTAEAAAQTLGLSAASLRSYSDYDISSEHYSNDGVIADYIARLEQLVVEKEQADGVPEAERIAPLFRAARWKTLPLVAPQAGHANGVSSARVAASGEGVVTR